MMWARIAAAAAVLACQPACSADGPNEWRACEQPAQVRLIDWARDPLAQMLAKEVSLKADPSATGSAMWVQLLRAPDLPAGEARLSRTAEGTMVSAADLGTAAKAVVALCNGRVSFDGTGRATFESAPLLWAHFVSRSLAESEVAGMLRAIAAAGYAGVVVEIGAWFRALAVPEAHEPGALDAEAWSRLASTGRALGLEVVPEVKLLTHQQKLLGLAARYEHLRTNAYTYDPDHPELERMVAGYVDEVLQAFESRALHIGHDEAALHSKGHQALQSGEPRLTPEQFVRSVRFLDELLARRRVEAWMWADMLLDPARFPMLPQGEQNGAGGFAATVSRLPRRIVLLDWHYYSPSNCNAATHWLRGLGFRVMTAGWWRADALSCQLHGLKHDPVPVRAEAQVVTTWSHVQRREWSNVSSILRQGARLYDVVMAH